MTPTKILLWPAQYELTEGTVELLMRFYLTVVLVNGIEDFKQLTP